MRRHVRWWFAGTFLPIGCGTIGVVIVQEMTENKKYQRWGFYEIRVRKKTRNGGSSTTSMLGNYEVKAIAYLLIQYTGLVKALRSVDNDFRHNQPSN